MSNYLNLSKIKPLLESNQDFSITEKQYLKDTGRTMPKDSSYLKNKSALAKEARKYRYSIEVKERTICLINERRK